MKKTLSPLLGASGSLFPAGVLAASLLVSACGSRGKEVTVSVNPLPPAAIDDHVVFPDTARAEAFVLDVSGTSPPAAPAIVPLVPNPTHVEQRHSYTNELLVLSAGQPDDGTAPYAQAGLVAIDSDGKTRSYRYDPSFDTMAVSDDGHYAVLYFNPNATQQSGNVFSDANNIAIVDLTTSNAPTLKTLRSFGSSPRSVAFTKMTIDGELRELAVILCDSYISLIDLNHLDRPEYTIGLARPGVDQITLSKVIFSTASKKIYLLANGSNDVYVVTMADGGTGTTGDGGVTGDGGATLNDFTPSLNQLAAGVGPTDLALYTTTTGVEQLLVVAPGSQQAVIIEPNGSNVTNVPLPGPAQDILMFNQPSPGDPNVEPRALLYTPGVSSVAFLDLKGVEQSGSQNVELVPVPEPYTSAVELDPNTVMLIQQTSGLSLLDLTDRTVAPIQGPNLAGAISDTANQKLWVFTNDTVGFLDLKNGVHPNQVRVDGTVQALVPIPSASTPKVVVTYPSSMGWATALDATDPTNLKKAYSMRGFLLSNALNGGAK